MVALHEAKRVIDEESASLRLIPSAQSRLLETLVNEAFNDGGRLLRRADSSLRIDAWFLARLRSRSHKVADTHLRRPLGPDIDLLRQRLHGADHPSVAEIERVLRLRTNLAKIARAIWLGLSQREMAALFGTSVRNIKRLCHDLYTVCRVRNRGELRAHVSRSVRSM